MDPLRRIYFDHEKLEVYQEALAFIGWLTPILERVDKAGDVKEQLDRGSTSVALNIAEGNGKYSAKDRGRFFDIANGSTLECAAGLDILVAKRKLTIDEIAPGKDRLCKITRMLIGLLKSITDRDYVRGPRAKEEG